MKRTFRSKVVRQFNKVFDKDLWKSENLSRRCGTENALHGCMEFEAVFHGCNLETSEFEAALHGCKSKMGEFEAKVHGCMLASREFGASLHGCPSKKVRRQLGEPSRRGGGVGAHASLGTRALKGQARSRKSADLFDRSGMSSRQVDSAVVSAFVPHARLFSFDPSLVSNNSCGAHGLGGMNSCGSMHGAVMHDNSFGCM